MQGGSYIAFGVVEALCFIIAAPGSAIILIHFILKSKDRSASTFLYIWISVMDLIICLHTLASSVSDFYSGEPMMFGNKLFCNISGFLWVVSSTMSVFTIAVLSIARTISITFPFCKVKRIHVAIPMIMYMIIVLFEMSLPFLFQTNTEQYGYTYSVGVAQCLFYIEHVFDDASVPYWIFYNWATFGNILLPLPIVIISCCVTVYQLRARGSEIRNSEGGKIKREATITILILTGIYIAFNAPPCIVWMLNLPSIPIIWFETMRKLLGEHYVFFVKGIHFTLVKLNSLCNVVVYFCRMKDLRQFVNVWKNQVLSQQGSDINGSRRVAYPTASGVARTDSSRV